MRFDGKPRFLRRSQTGLHPTLSIHPALSLSNRSSPIISKPSPGNLVPDHDWYNVPLESNRIYVDIPAVLRKCIAVVLLGSWLLSIHSTTLNNENPGELSNGHRLVKPDLSSVNGAIRAHEYRQRDLPSTVSGAITLCLAIRRFGSQRNKEISEHSKRSFKIYELNRAFLI